MNENNDELEVLETKEIDFYDDTLLGIKDNTGKVWLAIAHTCKELGFNERRVRQQGEKIRADKVLSKGIRKFGLPTNGGIQNVFCIEEKFVPLWLAKITLTTKMEEEIPNVVEKLEKYQMDAAKVLHEAFYKTEEQKQKLHSEMGMTGEIYKLEEKIDNMEYVLKEYTAKLTKVMDNMTLTTRQQQKINKTAKDRVNHLLGGAHTKEYKRDSRLYFSNLWGNLREKFSCDSYKDLNPIYYEDALEFISNWKYIA